MDSVEEALADGADPDGRLDCGYTALALAAGFGHEAIVRTLLSAGAGPDVQTRSRYNTTPLMEASRDGHVEIARMLLDAGADPNHGDHALNWATYYGRAGVVRLLLKAGADFNVTGQTDDTAIEIAIREGHTEVEQILREAGAKPRVMTGEEGAN